jgi:hypothetical protein
MFAEYIQAALERVRTRSLIIDNLEPIMHSQKLHQDSDMEGPGSRQHLCSR